MKTYKKLGFEKSETEEIVNALNALLANYHVHYQKLRNFHWNVEGPDFFDIHEQFEAEYNQVKLNIDEIAERIRIFGHKPYSNLTTYLKVSTIEESPTDLPADEMVREIINDFEMLLSFMIDVTDAAAKIGDRGTDDMIAEFIKRMEKRHWMLTSFVKNVEKQNLVTA